VIEGGNQETHSMKRRLAERLSKEEEIGSKAVKGGGAEDVSAVCVHSKWLLACMRTHGKAEHQASRARRELK